MFYQVLHVLWKLHLLNHHNILLAHSRFLSRHSLLSLMNPLLIVLVLLVHKNICCPIWWWWCGCFEFISVIDFAADIEPFRYRPPIIVTGWRWNHRLDYRMMLRSSSHIRVLAPQIWKPDGHIRPKTLHQRPRPLIRPDNEEVRASSEPHLCPGVSPLGRTCKWPILSLDRPPIRPWYPGGRFFQLIVARSSRRGILDRKVT